MKKLLLVSASAILATSVAQAATTVNGGTVNFTGEFVNAACAVSSDTANQTVDLGQHRTASLTAVGQYTGHVPFQIKLVDCDTKVSETAKFAFSGPQHSDDLTVLSVNSGSSANATAATGVGIEINDTKGNPLTPDGASFSAPTKLIDGNNTVNFTARYKAVGPKDPAAYAITAGQANASANFVITYE